MGEGRRGMTATGTGITPLCGTVSRVSATVGAGKSKWFRSGELKSPPHLPPSDFQALPTTAHSSGVTTEAGMFPNRKSTARAGHRVWKEFVTDGLTRACWAAVLNPEMTRSPGLRSPWEAKIRATFASRATSMLARVGSRDQRRDRLQASVPTGVEIKTRRPGPA